MNATPFSSLGLPAPLLEAVELLGYEEPSSIQAATIPLALEGRDLIGLSETGSGKTAAFGLSGLAQIDWEVNSPQMIVICPTRELAVQVCAELQRLGSKLPRMHAVAVYGGAPMDRQIRALQRGVQVIVGTPGRLLDHARRGTLHLDQIRIAVLDEADRMLDMGFADEMEDFLGQLPETRQTLFFSATMNDAVSRIIQRYGREPQLVEIQREKLTVASIEQVCYEARQRSRIELISRVIDLEQPRLSIVFCNTKRAVDECTEELLARGYSADRLHGDIAQTMRERVLRLFREGTVEILVATDVAARGIDVDDVDIVFNYELPQDPEDYVHRIGRTGRAGRSGKAASFIHGRDIHRIRTIERYTRQPIVRALIPTAAEVEVRLSEQLLESVKEHIEEGAFEESLTLLQSLQEAGHSWETIAAALMDLLRESTGREGEEIAEDHPRKKRSERAQSDAKPRFDSDSSSPHFDDEHSSKRSRDAEESGDWKDSKSKYRPRPAFGERSESGESGMVSLFLNVGKNQNIKPGDIVGMLHNECHLERGTVGRIQLFPNFSLVEVSSDCAGDVIRLSSDAQLRGMHFKIDYDRGAGAVRDRHQGGHEPRKGGRFQGARSHGSERYSSYSKPKKRFDTWRSDDGDDHKGRAYGGKGGKGPRDERYESDRGYGKRDKRKPFQNRDNRDHGYGKGRKHWER